MAFDSYLYGDPEKVLMRKQAEEARKRRQYGRRCELFEIKKGT